MDNRYAQTFTDIDFNFFAHPRTGDITIKENDEAIKQSVKNLVLTNFGERPFRSKLGSRVKSLLFELSTPLTTWSIETEIRNVINNYEPRVNILNVIVAMDDLQPNTCYIEIVFKIKNSETPISINLILERTR